ncbi:hypothetical protein RCL_jg17898.t1 [Rhizophagus clarus]|uniref:Uncharacterized protein n=1 Tax=Rhizophagus clarus TaxID=94130 RepID=A0A8H3L678_9GLOM|nr:hypothetical protein RCL_jg17898.t1 [Rhizophagus clarus]
MSKEKKEFQTYIYPSPRATPKIKNDGKERQQRSKKIKNKPILLKLTIPEFRDFLKITATNYTVLLYTLIPYFSLSSKGLIERLDFKLRIGLKLG